MNSLRLRAKAELERRDRAKQGQAHEHPEDWRSWLKLIYPELFDKPFAKHHAEFWRWIEAIDIHSRPKPFFAVWARGGAKTTSAEAAVVRLGAKKARKFCLYVRGTQDKANESVQNIAAMLESPRLAEFYPKLSQRKLGKYGFARGWRVDNLRCASGFSVVALGFDAAVRGVKIEEARPDLIILDDIDDIKDSPKAVAKKVRTLTSSILPAGANNVAILGVQNLMHERSIFNSLVEDSADFLHDKVISGPHPAVKGLVYEEREFGYGIVAGNATWEGQPLELCEKQMSDWGLSAFLREAQHKVTQRDGIWGHVKFKHCRKSELPSIVRGSVWVDPAVTDTDKSDAVGIQADGLGSDNMLYRFHSYEEVTSPESALEEAIYQALALGFTAVGVETDQGGDLWRGTYNAVWERVRSSCKELYRADKDDRQPDVEAKFMRFSPVAKDVALGNLTRPVFKSAKAGAGRGSKADRNMRMLVDYERGEVVHVTDDGSYQALERALLRFPSKPLDLADASYYAWEDLKSGVRVGSTSAHSLAGHRQTLAKADDTEADSENVMLVYKLKRKLIVNAAGQRWNLDDGWERLVDRELAERVVAKFPNAFELGG